MSLQHDSNEKGCVLCFSWLAQESHCLSRLCTVQMCHFWCQKTWVSFTWQVWDPPSCSACAASQMSQYILTPMLLCVGPYPDLHPPAGGWKWGKTLHHRNPSWKRHVEENECYYRWTELPLWLPVWMGSEGKWAEAGAEYCSTVVVSSQYSFGWPCITCGVHAGTLPPPVSLQTGAAGIWGSRHGSQQGTARRSDPMVWCTTLASQRRTTNTTDGHKQGFLPKAAPTVCCLSLSWPSTCIPAWAVAATWIASCSGPPQGWQVIHVCSCLGHGCEGPEGMSRERKRGKDGFFQQRHDVWKDPAILRLSWH